MYNSRVDSASGTVGDRSPGAGAETALPEALFVIDDQQRVVQWSDAAAIAVGVSEEAARGQPCYELVQGRDAFGRAVCQRDCHPVQSLHDGQLTARCSFLLPRPEGPATKLTCELVALPKPPGGAVSILSQRRPQHSTPDADAGDLAELAEPPDPPAPPSTALDITRDLASVATLATRMSPDRLEQSIESALDLLTQATGAEAAELFLREPQGGDMLLAAYRGPFRVAFSQVSRFEPGEGFPGLVAVQATSLAVDNISEDPRYLRTDVKEKGFHSYVCVPLHGAGGVIGVVNVASRRDDFDLDRAVRLLNWASGPISAVVQAGMLHVRENLRAVLPEPRRGSERDLDAVLRAVLQQLMLAGDAIGGALLLYDRNVRGVVQRVTVGDFAATVCPDVKQGNPQACPALAGGHGMALAGPRRLWPAQCREVSAGAAMTYCLPLVVSGQEIGIVQLGHAGRVPSPPTLRLPVLLNLAERAAEAIMLARANSRPQQARPEFLVLPQGGETSVAAEQPWPPGGGLEAPLEEHPLLEIRCLGAFELRLRGKLITPDMFGRREAITLLKILVIQGGRPVTRDALVELLWPEADPKSAANRFHVLVHALRRVIEPAQQRGGWLLVRSELGRYSFNPTAPYRLDINEFRECARLGDQLSDEGDAVGATEAYESAVDLYRGDLLEEDPYADWCREPRAHLQEVCLTVLGKLAVGYLEQGATEESIGHHCHALKIDPLREGTHRGLMRALWTAGRRDEALRQYQTCRDILRRELSVDPMRDTEELHTLIRNSDSG